MAPVQLGSVVRHLHYLTGPELTDDQLVQRFTARRDEAAFAVLVRRHGPLVWSVCRRALGHEQDAEDVFQATFLVLARQAASIRQGQAVASWLYHVAHHLALRAARARARRREHERQAGTMPHAQPNSELALRELQTVVDEELRRLPEKLQAPFVLCCLEGKSRPEAARELGWKEGTVSGRLAQARALLRRRLAHRGVSLSIVLTTACLTDQARAVPPAALIRAATGFAAHGARDGFVSAEVAALAKGATLVTGRLKLAALIVLAAGIVLAGAGLFGRQTLAAPQDQAAQNQPVRVRAVAPDPDPKDAAQTKEVSGRVLGPDGKPFQGAKLLLPWYDKLRLLATSDANGRFRFTLKRSEIDPEGDGPVPWQWITVIATADGYGPDWHYLQDADRDGRLTLRLVKDDVPITGCILDLQGRPVPGATVRIVRFSAADNENLDLFLKQWPASPLDAVNGGRRTSVTGGMIAPGGGMGTFREFVGTNWRRIWAGTCPALFKPVTTGTDGKFRLTGLGRERIVEMLIGGPGIEQVRLTVVTRNDIDVKALSKPSPELLRQFGVGSKLPFHMPPLYGARFEHVVGPTKPVVGTVRDRETGRPIAGMRIVGHTSDGPFSTSDVETVTDAQGHYRLTGLRKDLHYVVAADTFQEGVHLFQDKEVADTEGLKPLSADFVLRRAIVVEGRLLDKETGKPIAGSVDYAPLATNIFFIEATAGGGRGLVRQRRPVGKDGKFRLLVFPGPGVILGFTDTGRYLPAVIAPEHKKLRLGDPFAGLGDYFFLMHHANAYHLIDPAEKTERLRLDLEFVPGRTVTGSVVGPDGKPLSDVQVGPLAPSIIQSNSSPSVTVAGDGTFRAVNLDPYRPVDFAFYHAGRQLAGRVRLTGEEKGSVMVRLEPWGKATGRVLDAAGRPLVGAEVRPSWRERGGQTLGTGHFGGEVTTDKDGRFEMDGLLPGLPFELAVLVAAHNGEPAVHVVYRFKDLTWTVGEAKDLGTVTAEKITSAK